MSRRAASRARPWALALPLAALALCLPVAARATSVRITVAAEETCAPALRERLQEQLAGVADRVAWVCLRRLDVDEPFQVAGTAADALQIWIDVTQQAEARVTLRNGKADRFIVRRVLLPRGLDEVGREEIGQIVRAAALAIESGGEQTTLSREQARDEVSRWAPPARPAVPPPRPPPRPAPAVEAPPAPHTGERRSARFELGPVVSARAFSTPVPVVGEVGLAAAFGPVRGLGGWLEGALQLPARDDADPAGVELQALAVRAGAMVAVPVGRSLRLRIGAGAGLTRTSFTPRADPAQVAGARPGAFWSVAGRVLAGADLPAGAHVLAGAAIFCDVVGEDVHYDLVEPDGSTRRVLAPFRLQPGLALRIAWVP